MQIKNIILSLAATVALIQAAPAMLPVDTSGVSTSPNGIAPPSERLPVSNTAPATPASPQLDNCIAKSTETFEKLYPSERVDVAAITSVCSQCLVTATDECSGSDETDTCYAAAMKDCMDAPSFLPRPMDPRAGSVPLKHPVGN